jgi:hypothetical protein
MLEQLPLGGDKVFPFYRELIAPLEAIGRKDLARSIKWRRTCYQLAQYHPARDWKGNIARFDQKFLNGRLRGIKRVFSGQTSVG